MTKGFIRAFLLALLGIPVTVVGWFVVAIALPFRTVSFETAGQFTDTRYTGRHKMVNLPCWARWWDNLFDGMEGDKRGWWDNNCREVYGKPATAFRCMWQWAACRNPANYFSRVLTGVDVSRCVIDQVAGNSVDTIEEPGVFCWLVLAARRDDGKVFPRFFLAWPWPFRKDKAVMIDIGWKIKLSHNGISPDARQQDRIKGSVFTISPWKGL